MHTHQHLHGICTPPLLTYIHKHSVTHTADETSSHSCTLMSRARGLSAPLVPPGGPRRRRQTAHCGYTTTHERTVTIPSRHDPAAAARTHLCAESADTRRGPVSARLFDGATGALAAPPSPLERRGAATPPGSDGCSAADPGASGPADAPPLLPKLTAAFFGVRGGSASAAAAAAADVAPPWPSASSPLVVPLPADARRAKPPPPPPPATATGSGGGSANGARTAGDSARTGAPRRAGLAGAAVAAAAADSTRAAGAGDRGTTVAAAAPAAAAAGAAAAAAAVKVPRT
jgi:hypothetical protein